MTAAALLGWVAGSFVFAGALEDYLARPLTPPRELWSPGYSPEERIPKLILQLQQGPRDYDRGLAVGNLQASAWHLAQIPGAQKASVDLLNRYVLPYVNYCRNLPENNSCGWRSVVADSLSTYQVAGDRVGRERCLRLLLTQSTDSDDRDIAILSIARIEASQGEYRQAMNTARRLPAQSRWMKDRNQLLAYWQTKLTEKEKKNR